MSDWIHSGDGVIQGVARVCALLSAACALATLPLRWWPARAGPAPEADGPWSATAAVAAVDLAAVTVTIEAIVLAFRGLLVGIDLANGFPGEVLTSAGFGRAGLTSLLIVLAARTVLLVVRREPALLTALLWDSLMVALWACLLTPALRVDSHGGYEPTGVTLLITAAVAMVMAAAATAARLLDALDRERSESAGSAAAAGHGWDDSLGLSMALTGTALVLLTCYHLAVPVASDRLDYRRGAVVLAGSAVIGAWACFHYMEARWRTGVAEAGCALASLGICAAATTVVPTRPGLLATQYPMLFNAMIVGLSLAAAVWARLALHWQEGATDGGAPWQSRLVPVAKRFVFVSAAMALLIAVVMAIWPRWPAIATMDHSLGRVAAGFSANLFLLLVLLWCSRRLRRPTLHILTVLSVAVTAGFLIVRVIPFTSMAG